MSYSKDRKNIFVNTESSRAKREERDSEIEIKLETEQLGEQIQESERIPFKNPHKAISISRWSTDLKLQRVNNDIACFIIRLKWMQGNLARNFT